MDRKREDEKTKKIVDDLDELSMHPDLVKSWSIQSVFHDFLKEGDRERKKIEPRTHIWATEVGKNHWERYMKMTGVQAKGDFSGRVLGKFFMGELIERSLAIVLVMIGVLKIDNEHITIPETKDMLSVTGYIDFVVGGKPKPWSEIEKDPITELIFSKQLFGQYKPFAKKIHEKILKEHENGLKSLVYEIKSVNSQLFWAKKDYLQEAYKFHMFQNLTYLRATKIEQGRVLYVSKDDHVMQEFPIYLKNEKMNEEWEEDVKKMTYYIRNKIEPPKPEMVIFDERKKINFTHNKKKYYITGSYTDNWEIKWSNYITQMGYKNVDDYTKQAHTIVLKKNNEIKDAFRKEKGLIKGKK